MLNQMLLTSVPKDKIPVIVYDEAGQAQEVAAKAVNLLRIGHPAVQVIVNNPGKLRKEYSGTTEAMRGMLSDAVEALSVYISHEAPEVKQNEVFGIYPPCETDPKRGTCNSQNCVFLIYKA